MKKMLFGLAAVTLLFASCGKGDDNNGSSASRKDQLMSGKWRMTASKVTISSMGTSNTQDLYANMDACEKDDLSIFRSDMHLITDEGATKCNSSDPQQYDEGIWALSSNDTKLTVTPTSGTATTQNIDQLDGSTLKLSETDTETISGITVTYTYSITFTHVN